MKKILAMILASAVGMFAFADGETVPINENVDIFAPLEQNRKYTSKQIRKHIPKGDMFAHTPEQIRKRIADFEVPSSIDDLNIKTHEETMGTFQTCGENPFKELTEENTNSQATESRGYANGQWIYWHDNGQMESYGDFIDGKWSGKWIDWYKNGQKKREGTYSQGQRTGLWVFWYDNGEKKSEGNYVEGKEQGAWTFWHNNGHLSSQGQYVDGKWSGKWVMWYPTGEKKSEGNYSQGKKSGHWIFWHKNGQKESEGDYN